MLALSHSRALRAARWQEMANLGKILIYIFFDKNVIFYVTIDRFSFKCASRMTCVETLVCLYFFVFVHFPIIS